uniref:Uncharacterized protein n=1 Tax=Moorena producens (strain JHB) TaxID=1454205 RepID=A0A1D9G911_MOOP1
MLITFNPQIVVETIWEMVLVTDSQQSASSYQQSALINQLSAIIYKLSVISYQQSVIGRRPYYLKYF